jgi:hypothetical protein
MSFSFTFDDLIEGMLSDPEFVAQCERNNREWDEQAAAELEMTVDEFVEMMEMRKLQEQAWEEDIKDGVPDVVNQFIGM